ICLFWVLYHTFQKLATPRRTIFFGLEGHVRYYSVRITTGVHRAVYPALCKQRSRKVPVAAVGQKDEYAFARVFGTFGKDARGIYRRTRGYAREEGLCFGEEPALCKGLFVGD